tara:strand:- start:26063 stop:27400 length:1338 start_codon:yes stop_codon:yes gene_type:complete
MKIGNMNYETAARQFTKDWLKADNPDEVCNHYLSDRFSFDKFNDEDKQDEVKRLAIGGLEYGESEDETKGHESKTKKRWVKGYASTTSLDRDRDEIAIDALKSANKQLKTGESTTVFFNHGWWDMPIGKVVESSVDDKGLLVKIEFVDTEGDENEVDLEKIIRRISQGIIKTFSIGFRPLEKENIYEEDEDGFRKRIKTIIKDIHLLEISVVSIPANPDARMTETSVKSFISSLKSSNSNSNGEEPAASVDTIRKTKKENAMDQNEIKALVQSELKSVLETYFTAKAQEDEKTKQATEMTALKAEIEELKAGKVNDEADTEDENPMLKAIEELTASVTEMKESREKGLKILAEKKGSVQDPETEKEEVDTEVDSDENEWTLEKLKAISVDDDENVQKKALWACETSEGQAYLESLKSTEKGMEEHEKLMNVFERSWIADITPVAS